MASLCYGHLVALKWSCVGVYIALGHRLYEVSTSRYSRGVGSYQDEPFLVVLASGIMDRCARAARLNRKP